MYIKSKPKTHGKKSGEKAELNFSFWYAYLFLNTRINCCFIYCIVILIVCYSGGVNTLRHEIQQSLLQIKTGSNKEDVFKNIILPLQINK